MDNHEEREQNEAAYRRLKETIKQTYPAGWFVGIADDQVVGAAADFHELEHMLRTEGRDPRRVLVVEAGVDYPEYVTILSLTVSNHDTRPIRSAQPVQGN